MAKAGKSKKGSNHLRRWPEVGKDALACTIVPAATTAAAGVETSECEERQPAIADAAGLMVVAVMMAPERIYALSARPASP